MKKNEKVNLIFPDTNVLVGDENVIHKLIEGNNLVVVPFVVLCELDELKSRPRIGHAARRTISDLGELIFSGNPNLVVERRQDFTDLSLDSSKPDNQIIATFNYVLRNLKEYGNFEKCKLISEDLNFRVIAHSLFKNNPLVSIESYQANVVVMKTPHELHLIKVKAHQLQLDYDPTFFGDIPENGGVLIEAGITTKGLNGETQMLAIRKGEKLEFIDTQMELFGLNALHNKMANWGQLLAFRQLTDNGIHCVILQGQAGTGKTLMAIAAALEQKHRYEQLLLVSPMVPLNNQQKMGFLPGDMKEKSLPWLAPFIQNLHFLENKQAQKMAEVLGVSPKAKSSKAPETNNESLWEKYGFNCQPLDYIRGQTITNAFIIIEEAQNLSQLEIKTIVTRAGEGSKLVFCGDLSQIDVPYLSTETSGLTYAIERLSGYGQQNKMVGVSFLTRSVRSKLAAFASDAM